MMYQSQKENRRAPDQPLQNSSKRNPAGSYSYAQEKAQQKMMKDQSPYKTVLQNRNIGNLKQDPNFERNPKYQNFVQKSLKNQASPNYKSQNNKNRSPSQRYRPDTSQGRYQSNTSSSNNPQFFFIFKQDFYSSKPVNRKPIQKNKCDCSLCKNYAEFTDQSNPNKLNFVKKQIKQQKYPSNQYYDQAQLQPKYQNRTKKVDPQTEQRQNIQRREDTEHTQPDIQNPAKKSTKKVASQTKLKTSLHKQQPPKKQSIEPKKAPKASKQGSSREKMQKKMQNSQNFISNDQMEIYNQYLQQQQQQQKMPVQQTYKSKQIDRLQAQMQLMELKKKQQLLELQNQKNQKLLKNDISVKKKKKKTKKNKKKVPQGNSNSKDMVIQQYEKEQKNQQKSLDDLSGKKKAGNDQNQNEQGEDDEVIDLQNLDINELKQMLQNQEFRQILEQQGYDVEEIVQTLQEQEKNMEQEQQDQDQEPNEEQGILMNQKFFLKGAEPNQPPEINEEDRQNLEEILQNIDPLELQEKLRDQEFRQQLEMYGFDVEELISTIENEIAQLKQEEEQKQREEKEQKAQKEREKQEKERQQRVEKERQAEKERQQRDKDRQKEIEQQKEIEREKQQKQLEKEQRDRERKQEIERMKELDRQTREQDRIEREKKEQKQKEKEKSAEKEKKERDRESKETFIKQQEQQKKFKEYEKLDLENMQAKDLKQKLMENDFRQYLEVQGYDVQDLELQVDQELAEENQGPPQDLMDLDLENMDPQELQKRLQNPQFVQTLEQLGVDVKELEEQVKIEIEKQSADNVVIEDEGFQKMDVDLNIYKNNQNDDEEDENQPLDENLQDVDPSKNPYGNQDFSLGELESMDPYELQQKLKDPQFRQLLEDKGLNTQELIDELDKELGNDNQEGQPEQAELNLEELENMDPMELREKLRNEEFCEILENNGLNTKELIQELDNQLQNMEEEGEEQQQNDAGEMDFDFEELENMDPLELREKLNNPDFRNLLEEKGLNTEELIQELDNQLQMMQEEGGEEFQDKNSQEDQIPGQGGSNKKDPAQPDNQKDEQQAPLDLQEFDLENMEFSELQAQLQNPDFCQLLEQNGYDVEQIKAQVLQDQDQDQQKSEQKMDDAQFDPNILENMSPEELKKNMEIPEFRQMLEEQGYNTEEIMEQLNGDMNPLENMDPAEFQEKLKDPEFCKQLEEQGFDVEQLIQQLIQDQKDSAQKPSQDQAPMDLEDMSPEELKEHLKDPKFVQQLEEQGYDTQEIIKQLGSQQEGQEDMEGLDLQNMDPEELKQNLMDPQFCALVEQQGYNVEDIINQIAEAEKQAAQESGQKQGQSDSKQQDQQEEDEEFDIQALESMHPDEIKLKLQNPAIRRQLEEQGYNADDILAQLNEEGEDQIDLQNMDPDELREYLKQQEFRDLLEQQGYDVQEIIKQVMPEGLEGGAKQRSGQKRKNSF